MSYIEKIQTTSDIRFSYSNEFMIKFGDKIGPGDIPEDRRLEIRYPSRKDLEVVQDIDPISMVNGLLFFVDPDDSSLNMDAVVKIQRECIRRYYKHVVFPRFSPATNDPHGIRKQTAPEIVRLTSKFLNIPWLLRYPLAEKLMIQECRAPVLLLLPGPSLASLADKLVHLSKHCVIVAIARTLDFCLHHGVEPDFVIQLDTFLVQRHFYENLKKLENTVLVALSVASISRYAVHFRGILFMDSFDTSTLPNHWRLRENPVSSLMACMGLAECLHAPKAILAGVDLCYQNNGKEQYFSESFIDNEQPAPPCILTENGHLFLGNRKGQCVQTLVRYLAAAVEAEHFAKDIEESVGTQFHTVDDNGILCPEHFPIMPVEEILQLPLLDRHALLESVDQALAQFENIKLPRLKVDCDKTLQALDQNILFLDACQIQGCPAEQLAQNPILLFSDQERDYHLPDAPRAKLDFAVKIARQWHEAVVQARNITLAYMMAKHGGDIPLLCLPEETKALPLKLDLLFRGFCWIVRQVVSPATPSDQRIPGDVISYALIKALLGMKVAFVSPGARKRFDYIFDVYPRENLVYIKSYMVE